MTLPAARSSRLASVDALRGLAVAAMLVVNDAGDWSHVYPWLEHAPWHGCTPADLIFPFFLLIVGVSLSLALGPKLDAGAAPRGLAAALLWRGLRIVALGLVLHAAAWWLIDGRAFRVPGVLQRIGICFAAAGLLMLWLRSARAQWAAWFVLLLGHGALLALGGTLAPGDNLADRIDSALLGRFAYQFDAASGRAHDPEGLLGTLGALATVMLGVRAGDWLRAGRWQRVAGAGIAALAAGAAWSLLQPLNKALWTPSFVLWTGGLGLLGLALVHGLVDRLGAPAFGRSMGINAITAYAGAWLASCALAGSGLMAPLYATLFAAPLAPRFGAEFASLAFALAFTAAWWALTAWFERRGWRLTI
jgi:predicted acyltransferase